MREAVRLEELHREHEQQRQSLVRMSNVTVREVGIHFCADIASSRYTRDESDGRGSQKAGVSDRHSSLIEQDLSQVENVLCELLDTEQRYLSDLRRTREKLGIVLELVVDQSHYSTIKGFLHNLGQLMTFHEDLALKLPSSDTVGRRDGSGCTFASVSPLFSQLIEEHGTELCMCYATHSAGYRDVLDALDLSSEASAVLAQFLREADDPAVIAQEVAEAEAAAVAESGGGGGGGDIGRGGGAASAGPARAKSLAQAPPPAPLRASIYRPIKRVMDYNNFFLHALKNTPAGHPDFAPLEEAIRATQWAAEHSNLVMGEQLNTRDALLNKARILTTELSGNLPLQALFSHTRSFVTDAKLDMQLVGTMKREGSANVPEPIKTTRAKGDEAKPGAQQAPIRRRRFSLGLNPLSAIHRKKLHYYTTEGVSQRGEEALRVWGGGLTGVKLYLFSDALILARAPKQRRSLSRSLKAAFGGSSEARFAFKALFELGEVTLDMLDPPEDPGFVGNPNAFRSMASISFVGSGGSVVGADRGGGGGGGSCGLGGRGEAPTARLTHRGVVYHLWSSRDEMEALVAQVQANQLTIEAEDSGRPTPFRRRGPSKAHKSIGPARVQEAAGETTAMAAEARGRARGRLHLQAADMESRTLVGILAAEMRDLETALVAHSELRGGLYDREAGGRRGEPYDDDPNHNVAVSAA